MAFSNKVFVITWEKNNHSKLLVNEVRKRTPCLKVLDFILLQILIRTALSYMYSMLPWDAFLVSKC